MSIATTVAALAGAIAGSGFWWWIRTGTYRRGDDVPRRSLHRSWAVIPAAAAGGALAEFGGDPVVLAIWLYLVAGAAIAWIDLDVHRIPDRFIWVLAPMILIIAVVTSTSEGRWGILGWSLGGGLVLGTVFLMLALIGSMGLGDVKLAIVTGVAIGPLGIAPMLTAVFAAFTLAAAAGVVLLLRGTRRTSHLAFGPALVAGAAVALFRAGLGV